MKTSEIDNMLIFLYFNLQVLSSGVLEPVYWTFSNTLVGYDWVGVEMYKTTFRTRLS